MCRPEGESAIIRNMSYRILTRPLPSFFPCSRCIKKRERDNLLSLPMDNGWCLFAAYSNNVQSKTSQVRVWRFTTFKMKGWSWTVSPLLYYLKLRISTRKWYSSYIAPIGLSHSFPVTLKLHTTTLLLFVYLISQLTPPLPSMHSGRYIYIYIYTSPDALNNGLQHGKT